MKNYKETIKGYIDSEIEKRFTKKRIIKFFLLLPFKLFMLFLVGSILFNMFTCIGKVKNGTYSSDTIEEIRIGDLYESKYDKLKWGHDKLGYAHFVTLDTTSIAYPQANLNVKFFVNEESGMVEFAEGLIGGTSVTKEQFNTLEYQLASGKNAKDASDIALKNPEAILKEFMNIITGDTNTSAPEQSSTQTPNKLEERWNTIYTEQPLPTAMEQHEINMDNEKNLIKSVKDLKINKLGVQDSLYKNLENLSDWYVESTFEEDFGYTVCVEGTYDATTYLIKFNIGWGWLQDMEVYKYDYNKEFTTQLSPTSTVEFLDKVFR